MSAIDGEFIGPLPDTLPVLPLRDTVTYPDTLTPLAVGQDRSIQLVNDVLTGDRMLVMLGSKNPDLETPGPDELHTVGHDLGRVAVVALFVLPLARLQAPFDEYRATFGEVLLAVLRRSPPDDDRMPLGAFLALTGLIGPLVGGRDAQGRDRLAARGVAQLGILSEIAKDHNLVK